jgi:putative peptide zinc metalloprotease protein
VYLTAPVLLVNGVVFLFLAPRLAGSVWASGAAQLQGMTHADGSVDLVGFVNGVVALVLLALPLVGMAYVFVRLANRMSTNVATWWQARPLATATASVALATLVALQVAVEWPDTFAEAVQKAQVAQAIEDPRDGNGNTAEVALPMTPAAEAAQLDPTDAPPGTEPPETTAPGSDESSGTRPSSSSSGTSSSTSSSSSLASKPSTGAGTASPTTGAASGPTTTEAVEPPTGPQPGTQTAPRGSGNGQGGRATTTTRPVTTPVPTTAPEPAPTPSPSIIVSILDLLF